MLSRFLPGAIGGVFAIVYFVVSIYVGLKGHTLGWQNRRFDGGLEEYFAVQKKWLAWGVTIFVLGTLAQLGQIGNSLKTK